MPNLFKKLPSLCSSSDWHEDFLTEIVAQVLRDSQGLTLDWLTALKATDLKKAKVIVNTQVRFDKLDGHTTDSRPDIVVSLIEGDARDLVFIESKKGSRQGDTQLLRYAVRISKNMLGLASGLKEKSSEYN